MPRTVALAALAAVIGLTAAPAQAQDPATPVPMGEPLLMWALTGDGQVDPEIVAARDKAFGTRIDEIRRTRTEALGYEVPGVPPPRDVDVIGRQWTAAGDDRPTPRPR